MSHLLENARHNQAAYDMNPGSVNPPVGASMLLSQAVARVSPMTAGETKYLVTEELVPIDQASLQNYSGGISWRGCTCWVRVLSHPDQSKCKARPHYGLIPRRTLSN
jgi:hypothetical protein